VRVIIGGVVGAVAGAVLVWFLATWHHWDVLPDDLQAAFSAVIGGALSFVGGYAERKRADRAASRRLTARTDPPGMAGPADTPGP
jgi:hypothetical protein